MRISILWRLALSFTILILLSLFLGYKSIHTMQLLQNETENIYHYPFKFAKMSRDAHIKIQDITLQFNSIIDSNESGKIIAVESEILIVFEALKKNREVLESALLGERTSYMAYLATFKSFEKAAREVLGLLKIKENETAKKVYSEKYMKYEQRLLLNIIALKEHADANAQRLEKQGEIHLNQSIKEFKVLLLFIVLLGIIFSLFAYFHFIHPMSKFMILIKNISYGDTSNEIYGLQRNDEMGDIARSILFLNEHIDMIAKHTDAIAHGNYDALLVQKSEKDKLVNSIKIMTKNLKENFLENQMHSWIQTGKNNIGDILRKNQSKDALGDSVLIELAEYTSAQIATLYLYEDEILIKKNGYAYASDIPEINYPLGEGIIGQAGLKDSITLINKVPKNYIQVRSALGKSTPDKLLLLPFSFNGELKGVVELGYFGEIENKVIALLNEIREYLAISYVNLDKELEIKRALEQEQAISEELQAQEEELRVSNEKLVEQSDILKRQKENLEKNSSDLAQKAVDLEQASKYKSEFLANMSHELRTPLNSLLILSNSLSQNEEKNMSNDEVESAKVIHESGEHLLSLINDILDISKVEAGQMLVNNDTINIEELINSMNQRFLHMAREKNILFKSEISADFPKTFLSDRVKLGQIISNFISNALKFTQEGGVTLRVKKVNDFLYFEVEDSGIGIAKEKQKLIFESFQQADGSTSRNYGGTGLGLSIALSFTKLLSGEIQIESKEGEGSLFCVVLPLDKRVSTSELEKDLEEKAPPFEDDRDDLDKSKALFLIIEDDDKFSEILYKHIHKRGDQAIVASDGESGVLLAQRYKIDGIILDYMLPDLDGHDVLKLLKSRRETKNIPVHVLSALNNLADMKELGAIGQDAKPISIQRIDTLLDSFSSTHVIEQVSIFTSKVKEFDAVESLENNNVTLQGKRILLVDDDMRNTYSLAKVFRAKGLEVVIATSGAKALDIVTQQTDIDIIIMDIMMPKMDGYEVTRLIRAMDNYKDVPILAVTASAMAGDKEKCLDAGANDYMSKPIDVEKLFVMIQMWL